MFLPVHLITDRVRTLLDFTARGGFLESQDDIDPSASELPIDRLRRGLEALGMELIDLRQEPRKGRGAARGTRTIGKVRALLWHQTASLVDLRHALGIPAHALVLEDAVVLLHPLLAYLFHAGAGNASTIGIEIRARACGIEGDTRTLWISKKEKARKADPVGLVHEATERQIEAARLVGIYYVEEVERRGGAIEENTLHRLTSSSRVSDPGSRIAMLVALWLSEKFGLDYAVRVLGTGKKCPTAWGGKPRTAYNWRVRGF